MGKSVFMAIAVTVLGLLLVTGCERVSQITGPILEESEINLELIPEPDPPSNTGDCMSQVGPITSEGGHGAYIECLGDEGEPPDPE